MKTLTLEAEVSADGVLRLEAPVGLPPGRVEVVLVVQPALETNGTIRTGYEWLLDSKYDYIGKMSAPGVLPQETLTREEQARRIVDLLDMALEGVTWEEIEEGRRDRCF
ncbi:MAG: hypothetical protein DCC55_37040 [Chloroflexi bacterium]|nr:MAG: hypothetical protein DCC55_37040 [Chloroflexota bacterium]